MQRVQRVRKHPMWRLGLTRGEADQFDDDIVQSQLITLLLPDVERLIAQRLSPVLWEAS